MSARKTWAQRQAEQILADARRRYGNGWQHMSQDARQNYLDSRVLMLLLTQQDPSDGERLVAMSQGVLSALDQLQIGACT